MEMDCHNRVNNIKCQCCPYIETSQLICCANQLTLFYMRVTLAVNGLILEARFGDASFHIKVVKSLL